MSKDQEKAMQAIFNLCEAIEDGGLSIADIAEVAGLAVAGGHERVELALAMAANGIRLAAKESP